MISSTVHLLKQIKKEYDMSKNNFFSSLMTRKFFLKFTGLSALTIIFNSTVTKLLVGEEALQPRKGRKIKTNHHLSVVKGNNPGQITRKAIESLGGMGKFVKKGDTVVVKPNIGWNRKPEYAANTNPDVVKEIIKMCFEAGAKKVNVFDNTCNSAKMCYYNSGISKIAKKAGARVYYLSEWKFKPGKFSEKSSMNNWPIYKDAVDCDCFINVPIAKHHGLTGLTLSIKNLMGICGGNRGKMHWGIDEKLADLVEFIKPDLTIIDAYRILLRHGPGGGNLNDVKKSKTIIASADPVLADSYAATLFQKKPKAIGYIKESARRGIGSMNLSKANIKKYNI
jgi:uncharacterized protein (DUF362 family)